jgi:hypothetical protein
MHSGMRKARESLADQVSGGVNALRDLAGDLADVLQSLAEGRPPTIEELALSDVVGFFVENKGKAPDAVAGVVLREREAAGPEKRTTSEGGYLMHLVFLGRDGRPLIKARDPRRTYFATRLDGELTAAFGTNNIVIFN